MEKREKTPDFLDCLLADWEAHNREIREALESLILECREALGETEDTGERRREFRDCEIS